MKYSVNPTQTGGVRNAIWESFFAGYVQSVEGGRPSLRQHPLLQRHRAWTPGAGSCGGGRRRGVQSPQVWQGEVSHPQQPLPSSINDALQNCFHRFCVLCTFLPKLLFWLCIYLFPFLGQLVLQERTPVPMSSTAQWGSRNFSFGVFIFRRASSRIVVRGDCCFPGWATVFVLNNQN